MTLRRQFLVAFGVIASLSIGLVAYGVLALGTTRDLVFRLYDEPLVAVSYARAASATLNEARGVMDRALLLGPVGTTPIISTLRRKQTDIAEDLRVVRERIRDPDLLHALDSTESAITDWFSTGGAILTP